MMKVHASVLAGWLLATLGVGGGLLASASAQVTPPYGQFNKGTVSGPWTTATRPPTLVPGLTGYNSTLGAYETWNGSSWVPTGTSTGAAGTLTGTTLAANVTASSLLSAGGGAFGTAAFNAIGTTGATVPLNNGANVFSVSTLNGWAPRWAARDDSATAAVAAGSGYSAGDTITLNDGCATHTTITLGVSQTASSPVVANNFNISTHGVCSVVPATASALGQLSTTGSGSGATFSISYGPIAAALDMSSGVTANNGNIIVSSPGAYANFGGSESAIFGVSASNLTVSGHYLTIFGSFAATGIGCVGPIVLEEVTAISPDSLRNACGADNVVSIGFAALRNYNQIGTGSNLYLFGTTAVGNGAMTNWNAPLAPYNTAIGNDAAAGTASASFTNVTVVGAGVVKNLSTAANVMAIGGGSNGSQIGPTCASGNGIILIGSGRYVVDCPLATTATYVNIENILTVTGTFTPSTSVSAFAGNLTIAGTTTSTGIINGPSSFKVDASNFVHTDRIVAASATDTLLQTASATNGLSIVNGAFSNIAYFGGVASTVSFPQFYAAAAGNNIRMDASGTATGINIGTVAATSVNLGRAGQTTTVNGTLNTVTGYSINGTPGLASKTCTINTANAATGITLTITSGLITASTTC